MSRTLNQFILVLVFISRSTLAAEFNNTLLEKVDTHVAPALQYVNRSFQSHRHNNVDDCMLMPDFHRDDGYSYVSKHEDSEFAQCDENRFRSVKKAPIVFSLNSATGWFDTNNLFFKPVGKYPDGDNEFNDTVLAGIMDSFWDDYDCSWSMYIYPVIWRHITTPDRVSPHAFSCSSMHGISTSGNNTCNEPSLSLVISRGSLLQKVQVQTEQTINAGNWFFLDDRKFVTKKNDLAYKWKQIYGKPLLLNRAHSARAWVQTSSNITRDEMLVFELTATDDKGINDSFFHVVFVTATAGSDNKPPIAYVGADKNATAKQGILLGGQKSIDPDGSIISYKWTQILGPKISINYPDKEYIYAVMPDLASTLKFKLTVTDDKGMTASAVQTVTVIN